MKYAYDRERELSFLQQQVLDEETAALGDEVVVAWREFQRAIEKARLDKARQEYEESHQDERARRADEMRSMFELQERAFGEKVRQFRVERNWSQDELAEKMTELGFAMHQTTVGKIETGKRPLRMGEVYAFCWVFNVPIHVLLYSMPMRGEPPALESMRERIRLHDESVADSKKMIEHYFNQYLYHREQLRDVVQAMEDVSAERARQKAEVVDETTEGGNGEH